MTGTRAGLSVWLYRVVRDDQTLNRPRCASARPRLQPPPLPLRLHYLLAPMTAPMQNDAPETEQAILGKALQALHDHPSITGSTSATTSRAPTTVITSRFEPLTIDELARIWDALDTSYRTSVSFEVTVVELYERHPLESGSAGPGTGAGHRRSRSAETHGRSSPSSTAASDRRSTCSARDRPDTCGRPSSCSRRRTSSRVAGPRAGCGPAPVAGLTGQSASGRRRGAGGRPVAGVPALGHAGVLRRRHRRRRGLRAVDDRALPSPPRRLPRARSRGTRPGRHRCAAVRSRSRSAPSSSTARAGRVPARRRRCPHLPGVAARSADLGQAGAASRLLELAARRLPALAERHGAGQRQPASPPAEPTRRLVTGAAPGDARLGVDRAGSLADGDLVGLDLADADRREYLTVGRHRRPARRQLAGRRRPHGPGAGIARRYDHGAPGARPPGAAPPDATLTEAAEPGDTTVFVDTTAAVRHRRDPARAATPTIDDEYLDSHLFRATTNADGLARLPALSPGRRRRDHRDARRPAARPRASPRTTRRPPTRSQLTLRDHDRDRLGRRRIPMPEYLAPGVYVEEIDTGSKPIEGVSTSTCGVVGVAERGPVDVPVLVTSVGEYVRWYGGLLRSGRLRRAPLSCRTPSRASSPTAASGPTWCACSTPRPRKAASSLFYPGTTAPIAVGAGPPGRRGHRLRRPPRPPLVCCPAPDWPRTTGCASGTAATPSTGRSPPRRPPRPCWCRWRCR